jgi:hypothetical protein
MTRHSTPLAGDPPYRPGMDRRRFLPATTEFLVRQKLVASLARPGVNVSGSYLRRV